MKEKRMMAPYMHSTDLAVNVALTMARLNRRILDVNPAYVRPTKYQLRVKRKAAERRARLHVVR